MHGIKDLNVNNAGLVEKIKYSYLRRVIEFTTITRPIIMMNSAQI